MLDGAAAPWRDAVMRRHRGVTHTRRDDESLERMVVRRDDDRSVCMTSSRRALGEIEYLELMVALRRRAIREEQRKRVGSSLAKSVRQPRDHHHHRRRRHDARPSA